MATLRAAEALVGLPYVARSFDCMHLAVLAQQQLFGRTVRWAGGLHPARPTYQVALVRDAIGDVARPLAAGEQPEAGDAVLWLAGGGRSTHFHIGTLLLHAGEQWVLHTSEALGTSVLQRLAECPLTGLRLEGIYRWL
ncbi:MAG: hypothetical protein ACR2JA_16570 [Hydrogenophaga sp.]|uniref:hypothetical protein n=1 Tax=Hydrogenophaga sp. TaxID=1904254 RepID=UPI003D9AB735